MKKKMKKKHAKNVEKEGQYREKTARFHFQGERKKITLQFTLNCSI